MDMATARTREPEIVDWCRRYVANTLNIDLEAVHADEDLDAFGLDSALATAMVFDLEDWLGVDIPVATLFEHRTLQRVARAVADRVQACVES